MSPNTVLKALAYISVASLLINGEARADVYMRISELTVRKLAVNKVLPTYPGDALKGKFQGVAIAELSIDIEGAVSGVKILESPHDSIGESVKKSVLQWKFKPMKKDNRPLRVVGKLTFYFSIIGGKGVVRNPVVVV